MKATGASSHPTTTPSPITNTKRGGDGPVTYTRICVLASGEVWSWVACDLETGTVLVTSGNHWPFYVQRRIRQYAAMADSPLLEERQAFERIVGSIADAHPAKVFKRKMSPSTRKRLLAMINEPSLRLKKPKRPCGYRDGWYVTVFIGGAGIATKELGSFGFVSHRNAKTRLEQVLDLATDNGTLLHYE